MDDQNRAANFRQRKAQKYLKAARETTNLDKRQELLNLCEQELAAAAAIRQGKVEGPMPNRRKRIRRRDDR